MVGALWLRTEVEVGLLWKKSSPTEVCMTPTDGDQVMSLHTKIIKHMRRQATESGGQQTQHTADTGTVR